MKSTDYAIRAGDLLALVKIAKRIIDKTELEERDAETQAWLDIVESREYIMESIKNG